MIITLSCFPHIHIPVFRIVSCETVGTQEIQHFWNLRLYDDTKDEVVDHVYKGIEEINQTPVVFKWRYKVDEIAIS